MLHHLVPDEVAAGQSRAEPAVLRAADRARQLAVAGRSTPRCLARSGDYDRALEALRIASSIDLDDLTGTTAGGLHLATMGGLWQAFAFGFAGLRARDGVLGIDPRMPPKWQRLELRVRFRGSRVRVGIDATVLVVAADEPIEISVAGQRASVGPGGRTFRRSGAGWEVER